MSGPTDTAGAATRSGVLFLYKELWRQTLGQRKLLVGSMMLLICAQCTLLAVPFVAGRAMNALQAHGARGLREAGLWLLLIVGITAGSWLLHGPGRLLERNVAVGARRTTATALTAQLRGLPMPWHEAIHSGATAHRVQ